MAIVYVGSVSAILAGQARAVIVPQGRTLAWLALICCVAAVVSVCAVCVHAACLEHTVPPVRNVPPAPTPAP